MSELNKILKPKLETLLDENQDVKDELINERYILANTLIQNVSLDCINEERIEINGCHFVNVIFNECSFRNIDLVDVVFENCDLSNIDFSDGSMHRVEFKGCKIIKIILVETIFKMFFLKRFLEDTQILVILK